MTFNYSYVATSSYARKYALNGLFCIDDSQDLDEKPIQDGDFDLFVGISTLTSITEINNYHKEYQEKVKDKTAFIKALTERKNVITNRKAL